MCINRLVQHGLQVRLQLFKTQNKGWGIRCLDDVAKGSFVCIYAGGFEMRCACFWPVPRAPEQLTAALISRAEGVNLPMSAGLPLDTPASCFRQRPAGV